MRTRFIPQFFLVMLILVLTACSSSDNSTPYTNTATQMTAYIEQQMAQHNIQGLSIALVDGQNVVWTQGFGYADAQSNTPSTPDTLYEIASISKTFTAAMIMQLVEQNLARLDDPLINHIPAFSMNPTLGAFPFPDGTVTIRSILTHHSGIPGDLLNANLARVRYPNYNSQLVNELQTDYASYPVDFASAYSNTAISFLADVIEAASAKTFEAFSDTLLDQIGMTRSSFFRDSPRLTGVPAKGYSGGQPYGPFYQNTPASGGIISSASDMAKYLKMMIAGGIGEGGQVLGFQSMTTMLTRQNSAVLLDLDTQAGLVWTLSDAGLDYAGNLCTHDGSTVLFNASLFVLRDYGLGVVVLSNSREGLGVVAAIARQTLKLALEAKTGIKPPPPLPSPLFSPPAAWTQAQLDGLAGIYVSADNYHVVDSQGQPGALLLKLNAGTIPGPGGVIIPRQNGRFSPPATQEFEIEFTNISGRTVMIGHEQGRRNMLGELFIPVPLSAAWMARLGTYTITNLNPEDYCWYVPAEARLTPLTLALKYQDGVLVMERVGFFTSRSVLNPVSDTLAYLRGLGRNLGSAVRIVTVDGHEELQFLDVRYRKN